MYAEGSRLFIAFLLHVECILWVTPQGSDRLDLDLLETVLPDGSVGSDTVIAEVNQNVPESRMSISLAFLRCDISGNSHGITIHLLAHEDIVVVVVGRNLLDGAGSVRLELFDGLSAGTGLLELLQNLLDVA